MRNCKFEELIDEYFLNRLTEDEKSTFEEGAVWPSSPTNQGVCQTIFGLT